MVEVKRVLLKLARFIDVVVGKELTSIVTSDSHVTIPESKLLSLVKWHQRPVEIVLACA